MALHVQKDPPTTETQEIAERELREFPEVVQESLVKLREIVNNDKDIYFKDDDETLTIFLRPCKWYPESAHELVSKCIIYFMFYILRYMSFNEFYQR